ncbi:MAG: DoxX family protein [Bacteroidota bacterium]
MMRRDSQPVSKGRMWTARVLSGIAILFLLFDSVIHLMVIAPVVEAFGQLGLPINLSVPIGTIEIVCLALYVVPRTSIFGAVLLTGYLGGAILTQLRIGAPLFSTALFPVYLGILIWGGLYLTDERLRSLIPLRKDGRT